MLLIKRGLADIVIVGGVDVLVDPIMVTGFFCWELCLLE